MGIGKHGYWLMSALALAGCGAQRDARETIGESRQAVVTETVFTLYGPGGVLRDGLALSASNSLQLADRVKVVDATGAYAEVANVGAGTTNVGTDNKLGDLWSRGPLTLRERARVNGVAEVAGSVTTQNGVVITGGTRTNSKLKAVTLASLSATFDVACGGPANLEPDQTRTLDPNSYTSVNIKSRATLTLKSGTYRFDSLTLESQSKLDISSATGPVVIYVKGGLTFRGSIVGGNAAAKLLVAVASTGVANIEAPFQGSIVAPFGKIKLATVGSAGHTGSFFAKDIEVAPDTTVTLVPFAWGAVLPVGGTRVSARVSAVLNGQAISVPDASIELSAKNQTSCAAASYRVLARQIGDDNGIAAVSVPASAGALRLCASAPGFAQSCRDLDLAQLPDTFAELALGTPTGAAYGKVLAADGSLCGAKRANFGTNVKASVTLAQGSNVLRTVSANADGRYAVALPGAGSYSLTASCGTSQITDTLSVAAGDTSALQRDLQIGNRAPRLLAFSAFHQDGSPALTTTPGEVLRIKLSGYDPEGYVLKLRFRDAAGGALAATTAAFNYTVPSSGIVTLWAEASDPSGAYAYESLSLGGNAAGNRFIGTLKSSEGGALANAAVQVKSFRGDTLLGTSRVFTDSSGSFRSSLADADRFVVSLDTPGLSPIARVFERSAGGIDLRAQSSKEHVITDANLPFSVIDSDLGMQLNFPENALRNAAGDLPIGPVRVLIDRDRDGSWVLGDGKLRDALTELPSTAISPAVVAIVSASNFNDIYRLAPGKAAEILMPTRDQLLDAGLVDIAKLGDNGIWQKVPGNALRDAIGRYGFSTGDLGIIGVYQPGLGKACVRTRVDRASMVVPLDVTLKDDHGKVIRSFSINDYGYHTIEFGKAGLYSISAKPNSPSLVPGHDQFSIFHTINVHETNWAAGRTVGPCETRDDLFRRDVPAHDRYLSRGPENDEAYAIDYYDEVSASSVANTLQAFKTKNGFAAGDAVEARFYNRNELGIGRKLTCRRDSSVLACYLVKYGEPGGPVEETLDDLMNDTNPGDTVAMEWTPRNGVRFYIYGAPGNLKNSTHFDMEGEKFAPGVCRGCHGSGTFVPVDPTTHVYRNEAERKAASEPIRKINKMIYDTPGSTTESIRKYIQRLYPNGVQNLISPAVEQVPPLYVNAGQESFYQNAIKPYCQLCHLGADRPDWTTSPMALGATVKRYACEGRAMPHGFIAHRNLWDSGILKTEFGCDDWQPPTSIIEPSEQPIPPASGYCTNCPCQWQSCAPVGCICPCEGNNCN